MELVQNGQASGYFEEINSAMRFFIPSPGFVVGVGRYDESALEKVEGDFVRFLHSSLRKKV